MSVVVPLHISYDNVKLYRYIEYYIKNYDEQANKYLYESIHKWEVDMIMIYDKINSNHIITSSYYDVRYHNVDDKPFGHLYFNYQISFDNLDKVKRDYLLTNLDI